MVQQSRPKGFILDGQYHSFQPGDAAREFISEMELAKRTGIKVQTLRNNRHLRRGFPYVKIGRSVRYEWRSILEILDARKITPEGGF